MAGFSLHYASKTLMSPPFILTAAIIECILVLRLAPPQWQDRLYLSAPRSVSKTLLVAFIITFLNLLAAFIYKWTVYNHLIAPLRSFPRPKARGFFTGWLGSVISKRRMDNALKWSSDPCITEGAYLLRSAIGTDKLVIIGPKALQEVLVTNAYDWQKPQAAGNFLRTILGDGLVVVEGDVHKWQRKQLKPVFGFRQIKDLYPMMWKKSHVGMDCIAGSLSNGEASLEIGHWTNKITLDIIGVSGLGKDLNTLFRNDEPLANAYEELLEPNYEKFLYFILRIIAPTSIVTRLPWRMNEIFVRTTTALRQITSDMVREKREVMAKTTEPQYDILALLMESGNFSDHDMAQQLLTFLAAGHDTTTSTFMWTVLLLAQHQDVQSQLRQELLQGLPQDDADGDIATLIEKLPILHGVLHESLRLWPSVAFSERESACDTFILGRHVPAGTGIVVAPWATNRSELLWGAAAGDFKPERWMTNGVPNNTGGIDNNYSFMTFLHGPRSCIGQGFAKAELKCLLAAFVGRFSWTLDMKIEDIVPSGAVTIKPAGGLHIRLKDLRATSGKS